MAAASEFAQGVAGIFLGCSSGDSGGISDRDVENSNDGAESGDSNLQTGVATSLVADRLIDL